MFTYSKPTIQSAAIITLLIALVLGIVQPAYAQEPVPNDAQPTA